MTKRDELIALAERCEKAVEGSRELDAGIYHALNPGIQVFGDHAIDRFGFGKAVPHYTASLDAARTLVPSGMEIELTDIYGVARAGVGLNVTSGPCYGERKGGYLALALCAAALRAQAEMES